MPIPLRPSAEAADSSPTRARRRAGMPISDAGGVRLAAPRAGSRAGERAPFRVIRREPDRASNAPRPSENDGWPCLPYTER